MKILFVMPWFLPNKGGMEIGAYELGCELIRRGHEVTVATLRYSRDWPSEENMGGIRVLRMPTLGLRPFVRFSELTHTISPFFSLGRIMDSIRPDIVHLHYILFTGQAGLRAAEKRGIPTLLTLVGSDVYDPHRVTGDFLHPWNQRIVRSAGQVVAACTFIGRTTANKFRIPESAIKIIPYGVNADRFVSSGDAAAIRRKLGVPEKALLVLTVQRLHKRKGVHHTIDAADIFLRKKPEAFLVIVGDGPERAALEKSVEEKGLSGRILFAGKVPFDDLASLYKASDLFAFHSLHEGFGIVLLEAMSCSKAVVTTRAGGTEDIVEEGKTGFLVPPSAPEAFAGAVLKLLNDPGLREKMGRNGRDRVNTSFTWKIVADRYLEVYKTISEANVAPAVSAGAR